MISDSFAIKSAGLMIVLFLYFILWIATIFNMLSSDFKRQIDKLTWLIMLLPPMAPIGCIFYWFISGKQKRVHYLDKAYEQMEKNSYKEPRAF